MLITQKNKYAIRAVFELAKRRGEGPVKTAEIADVQKIPPRFLEVILGELSRKGIVESKRGFSGGYTLVHSPAALTVGQILRALETRESLHCVSCKSKKDCELEGDCAFMPMWDKAHRAMLGVFDSTSVQDLLDGERPSPAKRSGR